MNQAHSMPDICRSAPPPCPSRPSGLSAVVGRPRVFADLEAVVDAELSPEATNESGREPGHLAQGDLADSSSSRFSSPPCAVRSVSKWWARKWKMLFYQTSARRPWASRCVRVSSLKTQKVSVQCSFRFASRLPAFSASGWVLSPVGNRVRSKATVDY